MPTNDEKSLDQAQENSYLDLLEKKRPDLVFDRTQPVVLFFPYSTSTPMSKLADHVMAFNPSDMPDLATFEKHSAKMREAGFGNATPAIIFPDHSHTEPMGAYPISEYTNDDGDKTHYKLGQCHFVLMQHVARAQQNPTAKEFDAAWDADTAALTTLRGEKWEAAHTAVTSKLKIA